MEQNATQCQMQQQPWHTWLRMQPENKINTEENFNSLTWWYSDDDVSNCNFSISSISSISSSKCKVTDAQNVDYHKLIADFRYKVQDKAFLASIKILKSYLIISSSWQIDSLWFLVNLIKVSCGTFLHLFLFFFFLHCYQLRNVSSLIMVFFPCHLNFGRLIIFSPFSSF